MSATPDQLFFDWMNREWLEEASVGLSGTELLRTAFVAGVHASGRAEFVALWLRVRGEINTPTSRELDQLLGVES